MQECIDIMFMTATSIRSCSSVRDSATFYKSFETKPNMKQHLFPNSRPSLSCFWLSKGNLSVPPAQSAVFLLSFTIRLLSHFQQRTILKVYQQPPSQPGFPSLCSLVRDPFPSSSPSGACWKGELCHGPVERKWRNSSHAVLVITLQSVTHPASDYK